MMWSILNLYTLTIAHGISSYKININTCIVLALLQTIPLVSSYMYMKTATPGSHKSYFCADCGASFTNKGNLNRHIRAMHEGEQFRCPGCNRAFNDKSSLRRHLKICKGVGQYVEQSDQGMMQFLALDNIMQSLIKHFTNSYTMDILNWYKFAMGTQGPVTKCCGFIGYGRI